MNQLKKLTPAALDEYNRLKTQSPVIKKTQTERINEALMDGVLSPPNATTWDKWKNVNNQLMK